MADSTGEFGVAEEALRAAADRVSDDLRSTAEQVMESQRQQLADLAQRLAKALRRSAEAFAAEDGTLVARYADRAAERAERFSDRVGRQSWRESLADIEVAARRRPELFIAGALAAGFLLVRLAASAMPPAGERP
jgi:hypothetical protein